ncbi:hypothetical protein [Parapedobacter tibetensis]|uniref:hypothetical protein n=1 Tax=Parapedobacter tibetensis TaxID=2972951 RepID=UPI00214D5EFA|nr:hypothetical protein [Parapedobacter tibetensis]
MASYTAIEQKDAVVYDIGGVKTQYLLNYKKLEMVKFIRPLLMTIFAVQLLGCNPEKSPNEYPSESLKVKFKILKRGQAILEKEIDHFDGNKIPVGSVMGLITDDSCIYITDTQQGLVHVLNRNTYHFKRSVGSTARDTAYIHRPFGAQFYKGNLIVGHSNINSLFKIFSPSGLFLKDYNSDGISFNGPFAYHLNNFFINDSIAYVVKLIANNGRKVKRYHLNNSEVTELEDVVPVEDLHANVDSGMASKIIPKLFLLKSHVQDTTFFAIPSNKYLVNRYALNSDSLMESMSLLEIPEMRSSYELNTISDNSSSGPNTVHYNFFSGAAIDKNDNLYFPVQEIIDFQAYKSGDDSENNINTYIVAVNLDSKSYSLYQLDRSRAIAPASFIDGKLWCYDFVLSRLLVYSLNEKD